MHEDQIVDRLRGNIHGRGEDASNPFGVVRLEGTRSLAKNVQRDLLIDSAASRTTGVEHVRTGLDDAITNDFTNQADAPPVCF